MHEGYCIMRLTLRNSHDNRCICTATLFYLGILMKISPYSIHYNSELYKTKYTTCKNVLTNIEQLQGVIHGSKIVFFFSWFYSPSGLDLLIAKFLDHTQTYHNQ